MQIIKDRRLVEDNWTLVRSDEAGQVSLPADAAIIVPLSLWQSEKAALLQRNAPVGVWLEGSDDPEELACDLPSLPLIAIHIPLFRDGRAYSLARLLRSRHGFEGDLRAFGDVLMDQLFYLSRVGFNAFVIREDRDPAVALSALDDFSDRYQGSWDEPLPLFRRRSPNGGRKATA